MAHRVLIAESSETHRDGLAEHLRAAAYEVKTMGSIAGFASAGLVRDDDVILADAKELSIAPTINVDDGTNLATRAALIVMTSDSDPAIRSAALAAGADDVVMRPVDPGLLMARLRKIARNRQTRRELAETRAAVNLYGFSEVQSVWHQGGLLTVVSANAERAEKWKAQLAILNPLVSTPEEMLADADTAPMGARVLLLEFGTAAGGRTPDDLALMAELRSREKTRDCAILAMVDPAELHLAVTALDLGAQDILLTSQAATDLLPRARRLCARKRVYDAMRTPVVDSLRLAATDPVTGLFNKRYAEGALAQLVRDSQSDDLIAIMIADLDYLKWVNDTYGHLAGDAVLNAVAQAMRAVLRPDDLIARIGGDEFLIVLRNCDGALAGTIAQRICQAVSESAAQSYAPVTISVGVAVGPVQGSGATMETLYESADAALYAAKGAGRNRIHIGDPARPDLTLPTAPKANEPEEEKPEHFPPLSVDPTPLAD